MLLDSVVVVVRTRPRAIPLAMITMRKSTHGFPFVFHIWVAYGAPLGGPSGRRSSAIIIDHIFGLISHGLSFVIIYEALDLSRSFIVAVENEACRICSKNTNLVPNYM